MKLYFVITIIVVFRSELANKYQGKLTKEMSGVEFEVVGKLMKTLADKKITVPGKFSR